MIRHLIILLVVGAACYGGVRWMYRQVDGGLSTGSPPLSAADSRAGDQPHLAEKTAPSPIDAELIARRNIFLPPDRAGRSGTGIDPFAAFEQSEPDLLLVGTVVHSDGGNRAIIYQVEEKKQLLVKEGDVIDGVSIKQVLPGKAVVSRGGRSEVLDIMEASKRRRANQLVAESENQPPSAAIPEEADHDEPAAANQAAEDVSAPLRADPEKFGESSDGIIIKGRITR